MKNSATRDAISLISSGGNHSTKSYWQVAAISIGIAAITWLVFAQTLQYDFIGHDDPNYIAKRPQVTAAVISREDPTRTWRLAYGPPLCIPKPPATCVSLSHSFPPGETYPVAAGAVRKEESFWERIEVRVPLFD